MSNICSIKRDLLVVTLEGDLDHHITELIRDEIDRKTVEYRIFRIVFDFKNVGFMDSAGIGLLMGRYRKIKEYGGEIYVSNIGLSLQRIFRMSGLYKILKQSFTILKIILYMCLLIKAMYKIIPIMLPANSYQRISALLE